MMIENLAASATAFGQRFACTSSLSLSVSHASAAASALVDTGTAADTSVRASTRAPVRARSRSRTRTLSSPLALAARCLLLVLLAIGSLAAPALSQAQTSQTWLDANANNDWSLTAPNWNGGVPWTDGSNAIFGGTGETVEIASPITVKDITFNSNGYVIADANADSIFSLSTGSVITVTTAAHVATISESIAAGDLTKAGAGILLLSGTNTFDGAVSVTTGTLRLGSNAALGSTVGTTAVSGAGGTAGIIELQNGVTITGETVTVGSGGGDNNGGLRAGASASATWAGSILLDGTNRLGALNAGLLDVTGVISNGATGTLQISTTGSSTATLGIVRISTAATYTGGTSIIRGRLQLGIDGALPSTTVVDIDTATAAEDSIFDLNGHLQTIAGLARTNTGGTGGGSFVTNTSATAATLTLNNSGTQTYSGIIQDGAGLVNIIKTGTGSQTLAGNNTYTGTTSVSAGTLAFTGSNTLPGAITVTGGALTMSGTNTLGAISLTTAGSMTLSGSNTLNGNISVNAASLTLSAANTLSPTATFTITGTNGVVTVGNSGALGAAGGTSIVVSAGGRLVLNDGVTITGKTLILSAGGNNNGALQSASGATATWAGNIVTAAFDTRIGGGDTGGNLIINGVISGTGSMLYSRANNSTTTINGLNTYTGDTQLFANAGAASGSRLVIGVDNALTVSRLSVISTVATVAMTLDLNGHIITLAGADTSAAHASGNVLFVQNNGAAPTTLTLSSGTGTEQIFNGHLNDGTSGAGGLSVVKTGTFTQTLTNTNGYTGTTTINLGTLQVGRTTGTATYTGSNGALASTSIILNGINATAASSGTLAIDNLGTSNNSSTRLADTAALSFRGGIFLYRGSEQTGVNSTETLGSIIAHSRRSLFTVAYGGTNTATLTIGSYARPAIGGIIIVNGTNLGLDGTSTASVSRILFTTTPDLVGTTAAASTGLGTVKNLQIVPGLLGEATATTGGTGTALVNGSPTTGTPNTFLTYNSGTGLRPLNPTDEFSTSFIAGDNVRLEAAATAASSMSVNSLILAGAGNYTATIGSGRTLTVASGMILFAPGGTGYTLGGGGTLAFGSREGILTSYGGGNTAITASITGTAGISYHGTGTFITAIQHAYSGGTGLYNGVFIPQVSSAGSPGAVTAGPFGTGTLILGGAAMRATTSTSIVLHNNVELRADTTFVNGNGTSNLTLAGAVSLTNGTRTLTHNADANTYFTGVIGETTAGSGLTIAGTSARALVLGGANTYTGATTLSSNTTLVINGSQSAATGAVNINAGTLGGSGTLGGATTIASGATLSPGDVTNVLAANTSLNGTLSSVSSLTLKSGSTTNLQVTTATFTSSDNFGGNDPGTAGYNAYVIANGNTAGSAGAAHDKLIFTGAITQETGAKINVLGVAFTPVAGQIFNLLDWSDVLGTTFSTNLGTTPRDGATDSAFDLDLPDLSGTGLTWDTSLFATQGIIVVTPEPARALLLALGLATFALRRRRK